MQIKLDRKSDTPLYIQIKNQIIRNIQNQSLPVGAKLPTERDLSKILGTSRNTVSTAYSILEQEGYLASHQGRGTFVAGEEAKVSENNLQERLAALVHLGLEEAWQSGLTTKEFVEMVNALIHQKEDAKKRIQALFVECNIEQANVFAKELEEYSHFTVIPLALADLKSPSESTIKLLREARFAFTTFNHVAEVKEDTSKFDMDVHGLAIRPCLEGLIQIARYPKTTRFAVVSLSQEFHLKFKRNLLSAKLEGLRMVYTTIQDKQQTQKIINSVDVVVVSPGRCEELKEMVNGEKDLIVFNTTLDHSSVRAALLKIIE